MRHLGAACAVLVLLTGPACRMGQPILVSASGDKTTPGTIGGIVSTVKGDRLAQRGVHAVQVGTSQRFSATTNVTGGFTIKVPPGEYHLEVDLQPGQKAVKEPGPVHRVRPPRLAAVRAPERQGRGKHDQQIQPEIHAPTGVMGDGPAQQRADAEAQHQEAGPGSDCTWAFRFGNGLRRGRQCAGDGEGRTQPL